MIRRVIALGAVSLVTTVGLDAATFRDGYTRYLETAHFQTVSEFLTGEPSERSEVVLRTQTGERDGEYFILTLDTQVAAFPAEAIAVLEVVPTNAKEPLNFRFPLTAVRGQSKELYLGVTGSDWPNPEIDALAWRVQVKNGETVLAEWKSFLWEMP
jgi:hypothetical protein